MKQDKQALLIILCVVAVSLFSSWIGVQYGKSIREQECNGIDLDIVMSTDTITIDKCNIIVVKSHLMHKWSQDSITGKETIEILGEPLLRIDTIK